MYQPSFNSVLVEIDDKDAEWGGENNENMLGKSYNKGTVVSVADGKYGLYPKDDGRYVNEVFPDIREQVKALVGKHIMWNEGTEAGTTFEHDGKLYGFIYWFDIRGVRE